MTIELYLLFVLLFFLAGIIPFMTNCESRGCRPKIIAFIVLFIVMPFAEIDAADEATKTQSKLLETTEGMIDSLIVLIDKKSINESSLNQVGQQQKSDYHFTRPSGSNDDLIRRAIAAVKYRLKDPYSARFRGVHIGKAPHRPVFGEVNAKNGFGGYTGYSSFSYQFINGFPMVLFDSD